MMYITTLFLILLLIIEPSSGYYSPIKTIRQNNNKKLTHHHHNYINNNKLYMKPQIISGTLSPTITYNLLLAKFSNACVVNMFFFTLLLVIRQQSLTKAGLFHSFLLGIGLWTFLGYEGWLLCVSYLILGSLVTKVKMNYKKSLGIAEKRDGKRGPENVWGSAATAMVLAILTYLLPNKFYEVLKIGYLASLTTKLSDTFGSEIGKAYGKNTYLITTLKKVTKGTEGAISVEGTLAGVVGGIILSIIGYLLGFIYNWKGFVICNIAAFIACLFESYIGATYQQHAFLTNELVNLINTVIGAVIAMGLYIIV